jgi:glycosyltransferase involved in cell wall biosynthesis
VVHRIVPLSPTAPSLMAGRCRRAGVPFVMGPLNGGLRWPRAFGRERRRENEWLSYLRGVYKLMPGYHDTWRNASAVMVGSTDTWGQVPRQYREKCVYVPENAIDRSRFAATRGGRAVAGRPIRVVFVGRLVPYKGADMLIEAAADLVRRGEVTVEVVGDGPMMGELRGMVERLGLDGGVTLAGWVKHEEVQGRLARADVLGFPSIREFGGGVVLEAMAVGVPPLVVDYGGPGELVTGRTGFLVPVGSRQEIVAGVRGELERIVAEPSLVEARSGAATRRAREQFTWEAKARQTMEVYRWVMGERGRPAFEMPMPDLGGPAVEDVVQERVEMAVA